MASDNVQKLKDAGFNLDLLSSQQRQAVSGLSDEEVKTLIGIRGKVGTPTPLETGGLIY